MSMRDVLDSQNSELEAAGSRQSWHDLYKSSSWIYVGRYSFQVSLKGKALLGFGLAAL